MSRVLPILFNTDMVRAILDGRKTVTRRIMKLPKHIKPQEDGLYTLFADGTCYENQTMEEIEGYLKPPYQPGDILYVRETWNFVYEMDDSDQIIEDTGHYVYYADDPMPFSHWVDADTGEHKDYMPWRPSIHMPKEAARIWLKVKDVRVEQLQEITDEQAEKEGIRGYSKDGKLYKYAVTDNWWIDYHSKHRGLFTGSWWQDMPRTAKEAFFYLWNSTIKKSDLDRYGWDANPYVFVIEFEQCENPEVVI